jgi:hypothetical protein
MNAKERRQKSNMDLWICSQELCPLDHRDGQLKVFGVTKSREDEVAHDILNA